ncbi:MAG TPA: hypothetical protein VIH28_07875 [Ignavibacteriaceae bacterium]
MTKTSLFVVFLFSVFFISFGVSRAHVEPEDPFGGPFIHCEGLNLSGDVEDYDLDIDVCYETGLWEEVDSIRGNKMILSYHNTLRNANEEVILPDSEIIDPANIEYTTKDMGYNDLDLIEEEVTPLFGGANFTDGQCDLETFNESSRSGEEAEFVQVEFEAGELLDIFVNFNDAVLEADKDEATSELEEWVDTIRTVVLEEGGSLEVEVDVKFLHNARGGNPNGAQGNEHHKVFDSCGFPFFGP